MEFLDVLMITAQSEQQSRISMPPAAAAAAVDFFFQFSSSFTDDHMVFFSTPMNFTFYLPYTLIYTGLAHLSPVILPKAVCSILPEQSR
jgi:hypothetical protein